MKRIALVQQKGGAAKTTLCVHLAVAAQLDGNKTAIIDIDPQASASSVWGTARGNQDPPVGSVIAAELRDALEAAEGEGYQVIFIDSAAYRAGYRGGGPQHRPSACAGTAVHPRRRRYPRYA
jgi:chromosome partitioning protein